MSGPVSLAVFLSFLLSKGRFFGKIIGSELLFLGGCVGFVFFWWVFAIVFALFFGGSLPKLFGKILLMSGLVFSGFVLSSLGFFFFSSSSSFSVLFVFFPFSRDRVQVVTGHPRTRTCFLVLFLFLFPAVFVCSARFGRASSFLAFFRGAILGPGRFWDSP